jgi:flagellar basal-body rod protein FlgG
MKNIIQLFALHLVALLFVYPVAARDIESFDLQVKGPGYLGVTLKDGSLAYTKGCLVGSDKNGVLTTEDGYPLSPRISVSTGAISRRILVDGTISTMSPHSMNWRSEGQLTLYSFEDASKLTPIGAGLYTATDAAGIITFGTAGSAGMGRIKILR